MATVVGRGGASESTSGCGMLQRNATLRASVEHLALGVTAGT
jgi:hypothetical protein